MRKCRYIVAKDSVSLRAPSTCEEDELSSKPVSEAVLLLTSDDVDWEHDAPFEPAGSDP